MDDPDLLDPVRLPVVTVLGGGIAGLTAAHELVERGFQVQVVESRSSSLDEYCCEIGGLAANQFTRIRAPVCDLHKKLLGDDLTRANAFRELGTTEATSERFPLLQTIRFDKFVHFPSTFPNPPGKQPCFDQAPRTAREPSNVDVPGDWQDYWDEFGTLSNAKLGEALQTIREAAESYMGQYFPALAKDLALGTVTDANWTAGKYTAVAPNNVVVAKGYVAREILLVQVVGYTDSDGTMDLNRAIANNWAQQVRGSLIAMNTSQPPDLQIWGLEDMLVAAPLGSANPRFDQSTPEGRKRSNRVEFRTVEQLVPGEHGFRFFPAFYRHTFDTMRRTPMFDDAGHVQGGSAFDQLVPTPDSEIARNDGKGPCPFETRRVRSLRQLDDLLKRLLNDIGMTPRDLLGLQFFIMRYMLSGSARRQREAEPISFIDYIQTIGGPGPAPDGTPPKSRFSPKALAFIDQTPRALAAMSASESDARTQYDIAAQLMMVQPNGPADDMTLNGPTTTSWLDHWKTYLNRQGVEFFVGEVGSLRQKGNRLVPTFVGCRQDTPDLICENPDRSFSFPEADNEVDQHRYVLATSFQHASSLVWDAFLTAGGADPSVFAGPFGQLISFDTNSKRRTIADAKTLHEPKRDPATGKPPAKYPLRTISGLQYFFAEEYRFGRGNVFFVETPWALTSISQFPYWRDRVRPVGPLLGQITVDLGNWHQFYPPEKPDHAPGHPAWYSSRQEIAAKTWSQIKEGLPSDYAPLVKPPAYFHIDRNIVFAEYSRVGFQGSAVFRIIPKDPAFVDSPSLPALSVTNPPRWSRYDTAQSAREDAAEFKISADSFVDWVDRSLNGSAFAVAISRGHPDEHSDIEKHKVLVSPTARAREFVIAFRGHSDQPFYLSIDGKTESFADTDRESRFEKLSFTANIFESGVEVEDLRTPGHTTFAIRKGGSEFTLGVANIDGAIELLDGPVLNINDIGNVVRLLDPPHQASGVSVLAAVRCNAVLTLATTRPESGGFPGIQPRRLYGISLDIGVGNPVDPDLVFQWDAMTNDTVESVRNQMLTQMMGVHSKLLVQPLDTASLVVSPVSELTRAVVSFLKQGSAQPYFLFVAGQMITLDAGAKPMAARRDALAGELPGFEVTVIDPGSARGTGALSITKPDNNHENLPFSIGVLNVEGLIELVGAPALTIATKDFVLDQPEQGFVVLRNDAEYLINIPDEFQWRPGLFRGDAAAGIPPDYTELAELFGNETTEIYSGHPPASMLKNWVTAGTYTATYTRITSMESANESGRHAAAAIIFEEMVNAQANAQTTQTLVADLPQIWKIEENELDDLKFYTDLDDALFAAGLPHVLDILSLTPLVGMLLEADLKDDEVREFLQKLKTALDGSKAAANQAIKSGAHLMSVFADAYVDLTKSVVGSVTGSDPASKALNNLLQQVGEARQSFKSIWGE